MAYASGLLATKHPLSRHVASCDWCQKRSAQLGEAVARALPGDAVADELMGLPPIATALPTITRRRRAGARRLVAGSLAVGVLLVGAFWEWPTAVWPTGAPPGPIALAVMSGGLSRTMTASGGQPGTVRIIWTPSREWAYVNGRDLPAAAPGEAYELWWIQGSKHLPAGVLRPTSGGEVSVWFRAPVVVSRLTAVGISLVSTAQLAAPSGPSLYYAPLTP